MTAKLNPGRRTLPRTSTSLAAASASRYSAERFRNDSCAGAVVLSHVFEVLDERPLQVRHTRWACSRLQFFDDLLMATVLLDEQHLVQQIDQAIVRSRQRDVAQQVCAIAIATRD